MNTSTIPHIKGTKINTPNELIEILTQESEKKNFLFRGQSNSDFRLLPNFFRPGKIEELIYSYPSQDAMPHWITSRALEKIISTNLIPYGSLILTPEKMLVFEKLKPLFRLYQIIMVYNYHLHKYHEIAFANLLTDRTRDSIFWTKKDSFLHFIENTLPRLLTLIGEDGRIIKHGTIEEDLTGIDETYPQHYDASTAALDWTYNFRIALFFALDIWGYADDATDIHITNRKINPASSLSIFVYEELINAECPVIIKPRTELIENERAKAQEGTFTYFSTPCSFYLKNARFPSIDDYYHDIKMGLFPKTFLLKKYDLPLSMQNQIWLLEHLNHHDINQKTLKLFNKSKHAD